MNSPPTPSGLSIGEWSAKRPSWRTSSTLGLWPRNRTSNRPTAIHGSTGWTRGDPSVRSVAWKQTCPSSRSFPNAASSGSASSNSAQVAIPAYPNDVADLDAARRELEEALGPDEVLSDPLALRLYARDASMVAGAAGLVVFPRSTDGVAACVRAAATHDLAVVPRGSGTGLAGASTPIGDALVVVMSKMDRILEIRPE